MSVLTDLKIVDNVYVKLYHLYEKNDSVEGHAHVFDHITLLAKGTVLMKAKNSEKEYKAPYLIVTPKDIEHEFIALTPDVLLCCIHAIRDGDGIDDIVPQNISEDDAQQILMKYPLAY